MAFFSTAGYPQLYWGVTKTKPSAARIFLLHACVCACRYGPSAGISGSSSRGSGQSARSTSSYFDVLAATAMSMTQEAIRGQSLAARTLPITTRTVAGAFEFDSDACIMHLIYQAVAFL